MVFRLDAKREAFVSRAGCALAVMFVAALVSIFLAVLPAHAQDDVEDEGEQLRELREQILDARERVGEHEQEERAIFGRLEDLDRKIDGLTTQVKEARADAENARAKLAETAEREAVADTQLERTRSAMSRRVVGLYKTGVVGPLRVLFSSASLPDLLTRASFLRKVLEHDTNLVDQFRRETRLLEVTRHEARLHARERDATAARLETQSAALLEERGTKGQLLARVRNDRSMERAVLVELERASRALEEKLVALGETQKRVSSALEGADFESKRGKLKLPVRGEVTSKFGVAIDAEFRTETFNKGVEIGAELGSSVRAVAFGEVRFAGWFRGYGKVVILDHGDQYFTVSGHLADIYVEVGQAVEAGDSLATSGDTGSLTGPSFYFEVRRAREPLDPMAWLK
jgi:septal ring factor EnvC (AmiA/AmiB activator)